jgi:hypothetical protein
LVPLEEACRLLAEFRRAEEAAELRHQAAAVEVYLRQQGHAREAALDAAEIRLRAERRVGELLREQVRHQGGRPLEKPPQEATATGPDEKRSHEATVSEGCLPAGVSKSQSSRWQAVAGLDGDEFERVIRSGRKAGELTTAAAVRAATEHRAQRKKFSRRWGALPDGPPVEQHIAYHEAGHAVVCHVLGGTVEEVSIVPGPARSGRRGQSAGHVVTRQNHTCANAVLLSLAGPAAGARLLRGTPAEADYLGDSWDREDVAQLLKNKTAGCVRVDEDRRRPRTDRFLFWGDTTARRYVHFLRSLVEDLLADERVWAAVEALAQALLDRKTLDGPEAARVIKAHVGEVSGDIL